MLLRSYDECFAELCDALASGRVTLFLQRPWNSRAIASQPSLVSQPPHQTARG